MAWGELTRWNADRGFGFVRSDYPRSEDVFIYGAVLRRAGIQPIIGTSLEFETEMHKERLRVKSAKRLKTYRDAATDEGAHTDD
jgi:cold shock CspA family protein